MKVAVSAEGRELSSRVDPRFGRAPCFVIMDTETGQVEVHDNQAAAGAAQGAGPQAAQAIADRGVRAVITGNVGPNAFQALQAADVAVYLVYAGTVQEAIERLKAGKLQPADRPSKAGR